MSEIDGKDREPCPKIDKNGNCIDNGDPAVRWCYGRDNWYQCPAIKTGKKVEDYICQTKN